MIRCDDQSTSQRNVFCIAPLDSPHQAAKHNHDWTGSVQHPLWQRPRVGPRSVSLRTFCSAFAKTQARSIFRSIRWCIIVSAPRIRHLQPAQLVLIPAFALRAIEATVLNRFSFGQTDLVPQSAIWKRASPLNLNQQRRPRKKEFRFCFCHALGFLQRGLAQKVQIVREESIWYGTACASKRVIPGELPGRWRDRFRTVFVSSTFWASLTAAIHHR